MYLSRKQSKPSLKQGLEVHLAMFFYIVYFISGAPFLFAPGHFERANIPLREGSVLRRKCPPVMSAASFSTKQGCVIKHLHFVRR